MDNDKQIFSIAFQFLNESPIRDSFEIHLYLS